MNETHAIQQREEHFGRFDWIVSDWTISLALLTLVMPAIVEGVMSLNSLPVV